MSRQLTLLESEAVACMQEIVCNNIVANLGDGLRDSGLRR